jgi:uncharacterized protein with von Willebrand factor type A (vWA) domain
MSQDELLAAMELDAPVPVKAAPVPEIITGGEAPEKKLPPSETVLDLDKWSLRKGKELLDECDELRQVVKLAEQLADQAAGVAPGTPATRKKKAAPAGPATPVAGHTPPTPEEQAKEEDYWSKAVSDFHAAAYEPAPEKAKAGCVDKLRDDFMGALMDTAEFHEIRSSTTLNPLAAEVATVAFAKQFHARREEAKAQEAAARAKGPTGKNGTPGMDQDSEIATMKAAAKACANALADVNEAMDAAEMCGHGPGPDGKRLDASRLAAMHNRVKKSKRLKKIAEQAGRFRRLAQSKQRMKVGHGIDEVVGVTVGDEISKLLPVELMNLTDDDFGLETMRRLLERETMTFETRAFEPVGKGPIVVTVDESGSMDGEKIETAKGLALAMAWIARKQKRWCVLCGFSGGTTGTKLLIPPGQTDEVALLDWLEHFFNGGTDMDVPLIVMQDWWKEFIAAGMTRGKTDIVMITDAEVDLSDEFAASFNAFKKAERVRMTAIVVDGNPGELAAVCDEVYEVPALTLDADAVGKVLSV